MSKREFTPEEIAKSLRVCATVGNRCEACIYKLHPDVVQCYLDLRKIAADMIEAQAKWIGELEAELGKLREENRWIPVEERLPELDRAEDQSIIDGPWTEVLVMIDGASTATCLYFDGEYFFDLQGDEAIPYRVTHWKHMSKGPEVGHE